MSGKALISEKVYNIREAHLWHHQEKGKALISEARYNMREKKKPARKGRLRKGSISEKVYNIYKRYEKPTKGAKNRINI